MNFNTNLLARLATELPGLAGALQPINSAVQLGDLARRQQRRNLADAVISALVSRSSNRPPVGLPQRASGGRGALQGYGSGGAPVRILDGLDDTGESGKQQRRGSTAPMAVRSPAPTRAVAEAATPDMGNTGAEGSGEQNAPRRRVRGASGIHRKSAGGGATLRKFEGTLARTLKDPAVLPGGWQLYGYEKESGRPVYVGPKRELRVYA